MSSTSNSTLAFETLSIPSLESEENISSRISSENFHLNQNCNDFDEEFLQSSTDLSSSNSAMFSEEIFRSNLGVVRIESALMTRNSLNSMKFSSSPTTNNFNLNENDRFHSVMKQNQTDLTIDQQQNFTLESVEVDRRTSRNAFLFCFSVFVFIVFFCLTASFFFF